MSDTGEETVKDITGLRKVGIAHGVRIAYGVVLIIVGTVAAGSTESREIPYFLGAFITGIIMSVADIANYRNWLILTRGNMSSSQGLNFVRIETGISVIAVLIGLPGTVLAGVNGVHEPRCHRYQYNYITVTCPTTPYEHTGIFKFGVAIVLLLTVSIIINSICIYLGAVFNRPVEKENVTVTTTSHQQQPLVEVTNTQLHVRGEGSEGFVLNTQHGQPEPFAGAILSTNAEQPVLHGNYNNHSENRSRGFVLNTRHGQSEPFAGAVLSTNAQQPMVQGSYSNHLPVNDSGSTGFVLNTRHGQPEPFAGAILSTGTQQPEMQGLNSLVSELQEQNRLLREQLALQRQRVEPQEQNVTPSAPILESPPSYESCMTDH